MKKWIALILAGIMIAGLAACGSSTAQTEAETTAAETTAEETTEAEPEDPGPVGGGWTIEASGGGLPAEAQAAFDKASESFVGSKLRPLALVGTQVVSGTNYMILCESTPVVENPSPTYQMVTVYQDLEGNAEFTNFADFNLTDYTEGDGTQPGEMVPGGWATPDEYMADMSDVPEDANKAFEKATAEWDGNDLDLLACLGRQVVAGTNYAYLCYSSLVTADPIHSIQVVVVYEDLDQNCSITNICTINPADFIQ